jgi:hypothetical protein
MDENIPMSYIARKRDCGCLVGAIADTPGRRKDIARETARWIMTGLIIERVTSQYVRDNWRDCPHELKQLALF